VPTLAKTLQWLSECKDVIFGYPTVVRFSSEVVQKILYFECVKIQWFDLYNHRKGENESDAFEMPDVHASHTTQFKALLMERQQISAPRFSYGELINLSRTFRL
jgi:hypothetical protein